LPGRAAAAPKIRTTPAPRHGAPKRQACDKCRSAESRCECLFPGMPARQSEAHPSCPTHLPSTASGPDPQCCGEREILLRQGSCQKSRVRSEPRRISTTQSRRSPARAEMLRSRMRRDYGNFAARSVCWESESSAHSGTTTWLALLERPSAVGEGRLHPPDCTSAKSSSRGLVAGQSVHRETASPIRSVQFRRRAAAYLNRFHPARPLLRL